MSQCMTAEAFISTKLFFLLEHHEDSVEWCHMPQGQDNNIYVEEVFIDRIVSKGSLPGSNIA
jgi:hypothetical protein